MTEISLMEDLFLTGRTPYSADTWSATIMHAISEPMVPPSEINLAITPAIEQVIMKACAKEPVERYSTASKMTLALGDALAMVGSEQAASGNRSAISHWRQAAKSRSAVEASQLEIRDSGPATSISNFATIPSRSDLPQLTTKPDKSKQE